MIRVDLEAFSAAASWDRLPASVDALRLARTTSDPAFPGALLAAIGPEGSVYLYGVAATGAEWRLLQPLLLAYVGPTVTQFRGESTALDASIPAERVLLESGAYAAVRLIPGTDCLSFAVRALERLAEAVALRPSGPSTVAVPTARLLARVEMCLATGDRPGALQLLGILRSELRLDTLNGHFLEVRILSAFRAWHELIAKEWFAELAIARKPSAVASAMLDALWFAHLENVSVDRDALEATYRKLVRPLARSLLEQVSPGASPEADRLRGLEGFPEARSLPLGAAAQELLDRAAEAPSISRVAEARDAIAALPQDTRDGVLRSGLGQRAFAEVEALAEFSPKNWSQWLQLLPDPKFTHAAEVARQGVSEWPAIEIASSEEATPLAEGLLSVALSDTRGRDRLIESLPALVRWVKEDSAYPRRPMREVYVALLQLFSLLEYRGGAERDAVADLLDACLALGVTPDGYRRLLKDLSALIDAGAGESSVYWLIDLAGILLQHPSPDPNERLAILNIVLNSFQPILKLLTPGQRASYNRVAAGASWPTLPERLYNANLVGLESLRQQSISIYTLTESAGRQAEVALRELEPSLNVALAHDHVASPRLIRLARDSDVFVLAAASAKHAATDCILANRGNKPLLYAPGRGFSGIVRVVEEYASRITGPLPVH